MCVRRRVHLSLFMTFWKKWNINKADSINALCMYIPMHTSTYTFVHWDSVNIIVNVDESNDSSNKKGETAEELKLALTITFVSQSVSLNCRLKSHGIHGYGILRIQKLIVDIETKRVEMHELTAEWLCINVRVFI